MTTEDRILAAIHGVEFVEAATGLTIVLAELTLREARGNRAAVKQIFRDIADGLDEDTLH